MRLNFRTVPHLPAVFSGWGSNPLLKTHHITAAPLRKLRTLLPESVDLALSDGTHQDFRTVSHLAAVFPEGDIDPLSETHRITSAPLGVIRTLLPESVDLALSDGRRAVFRTVPHLPDVFSEEDINPLVKHRR